MADDGGDRVDQAWITAVIVGSAESPDPILVWVKHLEREGKVRDVIVMESFPVHSTWQKESCHPIHCSRAPSQHCVSVACGGQR
jgi:hypothetical protein